MADSVFMGIPPKTKKIGIYDLNDTSIIIPAQWRIRLKDFFVNEEK